MDEFDHSLEEDIYNQNGYKLKLVEEQFLAKFDLEREWLEIKKGAEKSIEKSVFELDDSTILIKKITHNTEGNLDLTLDIINDFEKDEGYFLSNIKFNKDGSFSFYEHSNSIQWGFTDTNGQEIEIIDIMGQSGSGPDQLINVELKVGELEQTLKTMKIKLYLYYYKKMN